MKKATNLFIAFMLCFSFNGSSENSTAPSSTTGTVQRVRINFVSPNGYTRQLLLGFTPDDSATDGFDFGYDALNTDNHPDDLNWMIDDDRYVIQGVGVFDDSKQYPLGMFLSNSGQIEISLVSLENFATQIDVYIYDTVLDTYTQINAANYNNNMASGDYLNRFYVTFNNASNNTLSLLENDFKNTTLRYLNSSNELFIDTHNKFMIKKIVFFNINGQELYKKQNYNSGKIKIPLQYLNSNSMIIKLVNEYETTYYKHIIAK